MSSQKLLDAYLNAPSGKELEYWEKLSESVRGLVRRAASKRETGDLEDFEEDCVLAIWTKIVAMKTDPSSGQIDNLDAFIRQAVHNRYCDAIRRKRPRWYNLKLELMEICSGKTNIEGFALWQSPSTNEKLCGFDDWNGYERSHSAKCREISDTPAKFLRDYLQNREPKELPLYQLIAAIFDYTKGPVEIDTLTNCLAELTNARNPEPLSIDAQPDEDSDSGTPVDWLVSNDTLVEKQVVDASWFSHVIDWFWKEFVELSLKQRKAVFYGLAGDQASAFAAAIGAAEVAESLDMPIDELAELIARLPLPDAVTAGELGVAAKAVPSVRFKAWGRIRRRTKKSSLSMDDE